jgi:hypothetical protein
MVETTGVFKVLVYPQPNCWSIWFWDFYDYKIENGITYIKRRLSLSRLNSKSVWEKSSIPEDAEVLS